MWINMSVLSALVHFSSGSCTNHISILCFSVSVPFVASWSFPLALSAKATLTNDLSSHFCLAWGKSHSRPREQ